MHSCARLGRRTYPVDSAYGKRSEQHAEAAGCEQRTDACIAGVELSLGQKGQEADNPRPEARAELRHEEHRHVAVPAGIAQCFPRVGDRPHPGTRPAVLTSRGTRVAADGQDEGGGHDEADAVDHERCAPAERLGDHGPQRRADGQHRAPHRARYRGRSREILLGHEVRQRSARRRSEERTQRGDRSLGHEPESDPSVLAEQEQRGERSLKEAGRYHDRLAVEAVGYRPGERRHKERRQACRDPYKRGRNVRTGAVDDQADERDGGEPVAGERHDLREEDQPVVVVAAQQRKHGVRP